MNMKIGFNPQSAGKQEISFGSKGFEFAGKEGRKAWAEFAKGNHNPENRDFYRFQAKNIRRAAKDMERQMENGAQLRNIAEPTLHAHDRCPDSWTYKDRLKEAVEVLSKAWKHGKELKTLEIKTPNQRAQDALSAHMREKADEAHNWLYGV